MTQAAPPPSAPVVLAYRRHLETTHGDLSDSLRLAEVMFNAGFRAAIAAMVEFQGLPEQLRRVEDDAAAIRRLFERFSEPEL